MADRVSESWGTPGSYTFDIPAYAKDITYVIRGGKGGTCSGSFRLDDRVDFTQTDPIPGAQGQYISGDLEDTVAGNQITIRIGDNGVYNATAYGYDAGSPGGSGYHSGGTGGYAPNSGSNEVWHTNGGGAGGGGSSAVYFSSNSVVLLEAGGGGGAGGAGYDFFSQNYPGYVSTITASTTYSGGSNGGTGGYGSTSTNSGSGGGGGGKPGGQGGGRNQSGNHIPGYAGSGGGGYCNTSYATATVNPAPANRENGYFFIEYDAAQPPEVTLTSSAPTLINGQCITLTWETIGVDITGNTLTDYANPGTSGSDSFCPTETSIYIYTATNAAGSDQASVTITVYDPPIITLDSDDTSIIVSTGGTNINWSTTGDGDTIYWTSGLSLAPNNNINSNADVNPTSTTTYTAYVTGLGGTSPSSSVTVIVYYPPTISKFDVPTFINWGSAGNLIEYEFQYGNTDTKIEVTYNYEDFNGDIVTSSKSDIILTPSASAELNAENSIRSAIFPWSPVYDDNGPRSVTLKLIVTGSGGSTSVEKTVYIVIDETPDNIDVESSPDNLINAGVYSVNTVPEEVVLGELYQISDIDIPVEIKSDWPIQVDKNNNDLWNDVRVIPIPEDDAGGDSYSLPLIDEDGNVLPGN
jgi:hypothetical protein